MSLPRSPLLGFVALAAACSAEPSSRPSHGDYLQDANYRRESLERSLVNRENAYARLRLAHYATGDARDWDALPEWNPRTEAVTMEDVGRAARRPLSESAKAIAVDDTAGETAFFGYPAQLASQTELAVRDAGSPARFGFWTDDRRGVGGLVRVELAGGAVGLAFTCSTCHAMKISDEGSLAIGLGNARLDLGRLAVENAPGMDERRADALLGWRAGRVDVTTADGSEPVRIPDLRPARFLTHLHHAGAVRQGDLTSLAIRLETLIITSHHETVRPPRAIVLALAKYIWSLDDALPTRAPATESERRGADVFRATCTRCHAGPAFAGPPVEVETVGTDPALGRSLDRGTGAYRVPSLRGVSARGALLHDASVPTLEVMFDPARLREDYADGTRPGAIRGHEFGLDLPSDERRSLVEFLRTL